MVWTIICRAQWWVEFDDELSWLFTNRFMVTRYTKVKRMGITEILRRIWLFSANMKLLIMNQLNSTSNSTQNICKQRVQPSKSLFLNPSTNYHGFNIYLKIFIRLWMFADKHHKTIKYQTIIGHIPCHFISVQNPNSMNCLTKL